jgi:hypothetical protein
MEISQDYDRFYEDVQLVLKSKVEEFSFLGYESVSEQDIWAFLTEKKWKKAKEGLQLFEIVQSILSLKVGEFMNYKTVQTLKNTEFSLDDKIRLELLK